MLQLLYKSFLRGNCAEATGSMSDGAERVRRRRRSSAYTFWAAAWLGKCRLTDADALMARACLWGENSLVFVSDMRSPPRIVLPTTLLPAEAIAGQKYARATLTGLHCTQHVRIAA